MSNEELKKMYPIQDDTWPSRRWNKEMTDYVDLSGDAEFECVTKEELFDRYQDKLIEDDIKRFDVKDSVKAMFMIEHEYLDTFRQTVLDVCKYLKHCPESIESFNKQHPFNHPDLASADWGNLKKAYFEKGKLKLEFNEKDD